MKFFICGFTGSGKTSLLKELKQDSRLSDFDFIDLDDYILAAQDTYTSLGELINEEGFPYFRELETKALIDLSSKKQVIVSLGGGTLNSVTIELLKNWTGLWLDTDFETCYSRIHQDLNRPIIKKSKKELEALFRQRLKSYSVFQKINSVRQVIDILLLR